MKYLFDFLFWSWLIGASFLWLLPKKLRIMKKHGKSLTYAEMMKLAANGDEDVIQLRMATKKTAVVAIVLGVLMFISKF